MKGQSSTRFTVLSRLQALVIILRSGSHLHLSTADALTLFGSQEFPPAWALGIVGQFATNWKATVRGVSGELTLRVVGGPRAQSVIEVTRTQYAWLFGIPLWQCPLARQSGDLSGTRTILVVGSCGLAEVAVIIAADHAHAGDAAELVGSDLVVMSHASLEVRCIPVKPGPTTNGAVHVHFDEESMKEWEMEHPMSRFARDMLWWHPLRDTCVSTGVALLGEQVRMGHTLQHFH
jgi:propanediol utilization protein